MGWRETRFLTWATCWMDGGAIYCDARVPECEVTSVVSYLLNPTQSRPPGFSLHGILKVRILEWVAMPSSRASFRPRDWTHIYCISCIVGGFFTTKLPGKPLVRNRVNETKYLAISCIGIAHKYLDTLGCFCFWFQFFLLAFWSGIYFSRFGLLT